MRVKASAGVIASRSIQKGCIIMAKNMTLDEFIADVERKFNMALADMAAETTFAIEYAYETVIQSFYNEYTPTSYHQYTICKNVRFNYQPYAL